MKLLVDIADNEVAGFMNLLKTHDYKATAISTPDVNLFEEIKAIKKAFNNVERIKSGKLKGRPAEDFLNEL